MNAEIGALFRLDGRVALVTGAAGGLGRQMARALAEAGAHVVLADVNGEALAATHAQLAQAGLAASTAQFDVTDRLAAPAAVDGIVGEHGRLDILVNNAGIVTRNPVAEHSMAQWDRIMDTNLTSLFVLARQAAPVMESQGFGRIINTASIMGMTTRRGIVSYVAAKHGVHGLTRAIAAELGDKGVTCNAIAPGFFRTEINSDVDPQFRERVARRTPARRWGGARELAGPVVFLASEASSFVNGHMLVVDGGLTATLFETD